MYDTARVVYCQGKYCKDYHYQVKGINNYLCWRLMEQCLWLKMVIFSIIFLIQSKHLVLEIQGATLPPSRFCETLQGLFCFKWISLGGKHGSPFQNESKWITENKKIKPTYYLIWPSFTVYWMKDNFEQKNLVLRPNWFHMIFIVYIHTILYWIEIVKSNNMLKKDSNTSNV